MSDVRKVAVYRDGDVLGCAIEHAVQFRCGACRFGWREWVEEGHSPPKPDCPRCGKNVDQLEEERAQLLARAEQAEQRVRGVHGANAPRVARDQAGGNPMTPDEAIEKARWYEREDIPTTLREEANVLADEVERLRSVAENIAARLSEHTPTELAHEWRDECERLRERVGVLEEAAMGAACEARALEAENAELRLENETLKMVLPPIGSFTFPPGCVEFPLAVTIADLRDRLAVMNSEAGGACDDCGCAARYYSKRCFDCHYVNWRACYESREPERVAGACVSVGLRALCGRRLLDGGEVK